jgi:hypothetical protein
MDNPAALDVNHLSIARISLLEHMGIPFSPCYNQASAFERDTFLGGMDHSNHFDVDPVRCSLEWSETR